MDPKLEFWTKMKILTIPFFERYWRQVEPFLPMIDLDLTKYAEWATSDGTFNFGMRHKFNGKMHGIVRRINKNGDIVEASWKHGKMHGFSRYITSLVVYVRLWKDGKIVASFTFTRDFLEPDQYMPQDL